MNDPNIKKGILPSYIYFQAGNKIREDTFLSSGYYTLGDPKTDSSRFDKVSTVTLNLKPEYEGKPLGPSVYIELAWGYLSKREQEKAHNGDLSDLAYFITVIAAYHKT